MVKRLVSLSIAPLLLLISVLNVASQTPPIESGVSHELAKWRASHYSDVRYKLNLTLEKMSPVLKGTIEVHVKVSGRIVSSAPGAEAVPEQIILDWRKLAGHEKDSTISNVEINGQKVRVTPLGVIGSSSSAVGNSSGAIADRSRAFASEGLTPEGVTLTVMESNEHLIFRDGVVAGENVIKLDFTSPILTSGSAITRYIDKEDGSEYIYSLFVPSDASTAFPVFDQPDLKARFQLSAQIPGDWQIVANTEPDPILLGGLRDRRSLCTFNGNCPSPLVTAAHHIVPFPETKPISTYVFAFAAGPWQEFSPPGDSVSSPRVSKGADTQTAPSLTVGLQTHFYVRKSQAAKFQPHAAEVFRLTREGVKYLEEYFDYKFPWPKYDIVLIPEFPFGGMEHAGATFLRETGVIFPTEPTKNDQISRATLIFHETAHQWFGDTVTMRWFDDLWLKEGFANFMAYKTLEKVMPEMNAWKSFYERIKQPAYATDSTKGTTPIYQEINNLSAAKSAYGNIVYNKAPAFLRQAEFYLGPDKFQTAVRAFLKKHEYANATWQDLMTEFETAKGRDLKLWAANWLRKPGLTIYRYSKVEKNGSPKDHLTFGYVNPENTDGSADERLMAVKNCSFQPPVRSTTSVRWDLLGKPNQLAFFSTASWSDEVFIFPNCEDYGYGIFLLDDKSRDYVLKNIQNEKDDFLRSMMWGALWDSVREAELDPREYVELAIKNLPTEKDETITASVLNRVSTAMTYYIWAQPDMQSRLEVMLIDRMGTAPTLGQRITYYRALLNIVSTETGRRVLKDMLKTTGRNPSGSEGVSSPVQKNTLPTGRVSAPATEIPLKTKDRFDIVTRLAILADPDAAKLLADLEKTENSDDAKRYAYAARAAFATKENREKFWKDFTNNKEISESWIEAAFVPFNSPRHPDLSLPYLQRALAELPNLKRTRKIFFINGWLGAFIGGQKSQEALDIVNKFLADNPYLDRDLRLKILENVDVIERAVKIRSKYGKS
jgi:aminopeptidase N